MSRRAARGAAVEVLYAADVRDVTPEEVLRERTAERPPAAYTEAVVRAVVARRDEIDRLLEDVATGWPPARMSPIDRNILRVAVLELLGEDVPAAVAIDEAVRNAKRFSGVEAGRFVNGVLSAILRERQAGGGASPPR